MALMTILALFTLITVVDGIILGKKCDRSGDNLQFIMEIDMEGDSYQYATMKASTGPLRTTCGTEQGQITGSGNSTNPLQLVVSINATADIDLGSPDCGHVVVNTTLTWTILIVYETPPFPGAIGRQVEQMLSCNYDLIVHEGSVGLTVNSSSLNSSLVEEFRTVTLHQTRRFPLELKVVKEFFKEYGVSEAYNLADNVRLAITPIPPLTNISGVYGYNLKACNTALCDDIIFPMLDANGCKYPDFTTILGSSSAANQPSNLGTFMIGHLTEPPTFDFSVHAGKAFTEEFSLFKFIGSKYVYFQCSLGYCDSPSDPFCTQHCSEVTNTTVRARRKRDTGFESSDTEDGDVTTIFIMVEGDKGGLLIGYPRDDEPQVIQDVTTHVSSVAKCLTKPEYIAAFIILGILLLVTYVTVTFLGIRLFMKKV